MRYAIIGAGGVSSGEDAYRMLKIGASLTQMLTALIYEGPAIVGRVTRELLRLMERDGVRRISEVVGVEAGNQ